MIKNKVIISLFISSLVLLITASIIGFITIPSGSGPLIIRLNSISEGMDLLGGQGVFFAILGIAISLVVLNFVLALETYNKERFLSYMLSITSFLIAIIFLLVTSTIISIN